MIASLLLLASLTPQAPPPDLGRVVDQACHWLRWNARNPDGSYGKGAVETAAALGAFAQSPRGYREIDGPWIRDAVAWLFAHQAPDGSFGVEGEDRKAATRRVLHALKDLGVDHHAQERARAQSYLESQGALGPIWDPLNPPKGTAEEADQARKDAEPILARRGKEGDWNGSVLETAEAIARLSYLQKVVLAARKPGPALPAPPAAPKEPPSKEAIDAAVRKGVDFLMSKDNREPDGFWGFGGRSDPGITGLCAAGLLSVPPPRSKEVDEAIGKSLAFLAQAQDKDGAVSSGGIASYVTSVAIQAWVASGEPKWRTNIERAQTFLKTVQADEGEGYTESDRFYGGIGYGDDERPDLSNLNYALDGLVASGLPTTDAAFAKALAFLQRCQNRSESNPTVIQVGGDTIVAGN
ncbi:MAG TPA: hypothetical protein VKF62_03895, partial [Planctomycetota bacterium]|nr:hypothetical protein [Planctomycetota bacterium]